MDEKEKAAVDKSIAKPVELKSFRCAAPKSDWHIFFIAFLTSAIVVAAYHVTLMIIDMYSPEKDEPVYCSCHQSNSEEEEKKEKRKPTPEQREKFKAQREAMMKKLSPEQQEKVKNRSKEERREFFKQLFAKNKAEKEAKKEAEK